MALKFINLLMNKIFLSQEVNNESLDEILCIMYTFFQSPKFIVQRNKFLTYSGISHLKGNHGII